MSGRLRLLELVFACHKKLIEYENVADLLTTLLQAPWIRKTWDTVDKLSNVLKIEFTTSEIQVEPIEEPELEEDANSEAGDLAEFNNANVEEDPLENDLSAEEVMEAWQESYDLFQNINTRTQ